jgi:radical SAM superfamily enzyme YgiQ (UPF0313 family)
MLPSVYLSGEIAVSLDAPMIRLETKRGCPHACSFCAFRDQQTRKVHLHTIEKVFAEIANSVDYA